jgi:biopolymer transport protein TolQ
MSNQQLQSGVSDISDVVVNSVTNNPGVQPIHPGDSVFDMFWRSGFIVKIVILCLFFASIWSWTIIISKYLKVKSLKMKADFFEDDFWSGNDLEALYRDLRESASDPFSNVFCSAMTEWERLTSKGRVALNAIESKIERIMQITIKKEVEDIEKNMTFLSTLGTNGVIIGILGMVVSIMDGMKTIALSQSAGMAAVAPILSESLFTTALGVFAAIPAAIAYNKLSSDINKYIERLETFSEEFTSIIARQIEDE